VRKGDLIWFRDGEWHRLEAAADSEMRFLLLYAPGVFRTAWQDPSKASAWSPTGLDINGLETARPTLDVAGFAQTLGERRLQSAGCLLRQSIRR
jgi:hypothetical protein